MLSVAEQSDLATSPLASYPYLEEYNDGTRPLSRVFICNIGETTFAELQPTVNNGASAGKFGTEFGWAVRWMEETVDGSNLYIQKQGVSGNPISAFDPDTFPGNGIFSRMVSALAWLAGQGVTLAQRHFQWVQGESDADATQEYYEDALAYIISSLYSQSILTTGSISVLAQMLAGTSGYGQGVFDAKAALAAADPTSVKTVQMTDYGPDNLHVNALGQMRLASTGFSAALGRPVVTY